MATADAQQLRALITAVYRPNDRRLAVAIRAEPVWDGPDLLEGEPRVRVAPCLSPLAVRAALADHADRGDGSGEVLAVLTPCADRELGTDVLARLVKGRVLSMDPFSAVLALFRAATLDPALVRERWLIDDLVAVAPPGGWPEERPPNGVLDLDRAWSVWHAARLAGLRAPDSMTELVRMGEDPIAARVMADLPAEHRARVAARWLDGVAPTGVLVERIAVGAGRDLLTLGLVVEVLWAPTDDPALAALQSVGRARFEPVLGRDRVDLAAARRWADASGEALAGHPARVTVVDRADQMLVDAGVDDLARLSDHLPRGLELRLGRLAEALNRAHLAAAVEVLAEVYEHEGAPRRAARVETAAAAVRLLRRTSQPVRGLPATFGDAIVAYSCDGAWVDEARALLAEGDHLSELAGAYAKLCATVDEERRAFSRRFAELMADWSRSEPILDDRLVPLEQLLERVATVVASSAPVLVLVCDGMGLPVAHQLLRDLAVEGWTAVSPSEQNGWPVGVAMVPTVTEVSRSSLLAGRRIEGGQAEEQHGFTTHPALRARSSSSKPPALFHKAQLVGPDGRALPEEVRRVVADIDQRVVGVVVNAVDDHLSRGHQVRVGWDLASLRPLAWLLDAAAEAGRIVVLTADHGHVPHVDGAVMRPASTAGGERWRSAPPPAQPDELEFSGPRVLKGGRVVLPTDERLRYVGNKYGYHGGATPQEVLVPVAVLARTLPDGWVHRPMEQPAWWTDERVVVQPAPPTSVRRGSARPSPQASLFEIGAAEPSTPSPQQPVWVEALFASPSFIAHRQQVRLPRPLADERIAGYLAAIAGNGGSIPLTALAARTGEPADQLRMALTLAQRLVNLDGAEILAIRANQTVELNIELLAIQFGVEVA